MSFTLTPLAKGALALGAVAMFACTAGGLFTIMGDDQGVSYTDGTPKIGYFSSGAAPAVRGALGSDSNPLKISIVSFHGYAPALVANGASLTTQVGSIFDKEGVHVEFVIQDNVPTLSEIFQSDTAHCSWRTSDFWAQEQPNLRGADLDARTIMVVDNTQGADAIISKDGAIKRIEDLAGKRIALLEFTPSHGMVIDAVENSSLSARKKQAILNNLVMVNVEEGTAGVRSVLESGNADAAALWDPDLSLAMRIPGAHVVYSTKTATNLIYDVIVCDTRYLTAENRPAYQRFVNGWMKGVDAAKADPRAAVEALKQTEEFFAVLAKDEGDKFVQDLFDGLVWTGIEDNIRILGLAGGTNQYERVYRRFDGIYRGVGALANPNAPVINPQDSIDYGFIQTLMEANAAAKAEAAKPEFTFSDDGRKAAVAAPPQVEKPVIITFPTGAAGLNERSKKTINDEVVPLIENNGSAYFQVSGNTDSTGGRAGNIQLSKKRAASVVNYLVVEWEFDAARFEILGNGPDKPLCDEKNPASYEEGTDLEMCRKLNRTVRVGVNAR
ncbi:MAG: OmpA family protein [Rhodobacterales bacterium]|nr:OmpA family protein [Rhodobacterales bacterium]